MKERNPDGSPIHSILIDPRDAKHMYFGTRLGGRVRDARSGRDVESAEYRDAVADGPDPHPEFGYDPHCMTLHPLAPDLLYQQNHCGIYRMRRPEARWVRIGDNMPREIGDIGFAICTASARSEHGVGVSDGRHRRVAAHVPRRKARGVSHPRRRRDVGRGSTAVSPSARGTRCCGNRWRSMTRSRIGVYFGTTNGEVWGSIDEGESWRCLAVASAARLFGRSRRTSTLSSDESRHSFGAASYTARRTHASKRTAPRSPALLLDLDARYPGIRFRMVNEADALRPHMRVFVNRESIVDLSTVRWRRPTRS